MKNKILTVISVIVGIIILFLVRNIYSDYNLEKTVTACILAQKQTSKSFDLKQAKKLCKEEITKSVKN